MYLVVSWISIRAVSGFVPFFLFNTSLDMQADLRTTRGTPTTDANKYFDNSLGTSEFATPFKLLICPADVVKAVTSLYYKRVQSNPAKDT